MTPSSVPRDDLLTAPHRALRKLLFDLTVAIGNTDWSDPKAVTTLERLWRQCRGILDEHAEIEDRYVFPFVAEKAPEAVERSERQHVRLAGSEQDLRDSLEVAIREPDPVTGNLAYRKASLFVSYYVQHMETEESDILPAMWATRTDDEIDSCRARFLADLTPSTPDQFQLAMVYSRRVASAVARGIAAPSFVPASDIPQGYALGHEID